MSDAGDLQIPLTRAKLIKAWREQFSEIDQREIWEWSQDGELPPVYAVSGKLDIDTAPMIKQPLRDLRSAIIRNVVCMCGVQCLKTLLGELWLLWSVVNDPGPTQWLQPTDQEAVEHAKERFIPLLENFPSVHRYYTGNRHDKTSAFIKFVHMWFRMEGAETDSNLQRKSVKNQMRSEIWQAQYWTRGKLKEADSRLTQFVHNSKTYTEGQPGWAAEYEIDDMDGAYLAGNQNRWEFRCQSCRKLQPHFWSYIRADGSRAGLRWTTSDRTTRKTDSTDPNEIYRWNEIVPTIRYECIHCGHPHHDDPVIRRRMAAESEHVPQKPDADPFTTSYNWNQLAMPQLSWYETRIGGVKNFLLAVAKARQGNDKPLRDFWMKVAGEPFNPRRHGAYKKPDTILLETRPEETGKPIVYAGIEFIHRCMMVDVQADTFWVLILVFSARGDILILHFEEVPTWGEVDERQARFKVPMQNVGVDISHREIEVIRECARRGDWVQAGKYRTWAGWIAFRGSASPHFFWKPTKGKMKGKAIELPYSWPPRFGDPCRGWPLNDPRRGEFKGKICPIITWSNPTIKDIAMNRLRNKAEGVLDFVMQGEWPEEYARQRDSQKKVIADRRYAGAAAWRFEKKHDDDHGNDCYCMGLALAMMRGWLLSGHREAAAGLENGSDDTPES